MNVSFSKSDKCKTKINFIIEKDFSTIIGFTGDIASEVFSQVRSAPAARTIHYNVMDEAILDVSKLNHYSFKNLPVRYDLTAVTIGAYDLIVKEIKALIANAGHPVVDIYGFRYGDNVYGFDYGFELRVSEDFSIFTDFAFIKKDSHNRMIYGVSLDGVEINVANRQSCNFTSNFTCVLEITKIPKLIKNIFHSVRYRNFNFLPDLSILLNDLYTDMPENVVIFCEPGSSDIETKAKVLLADSTDLANELRNRGANLVAQAATSSKLQELVNIGLAKVKQGTMLDELGVIGLVNSGGVNIIDSYVEYENQRYKVINGYPKPDDLSKFLYAANKRVLGCGNLGVVNNDSLHYITDSLIAEQPRTDQKFHLVYDDSNNIVGALTCYRDTLSYESQSYISNEQLSCVTSSDNLLNSADMSEIAVTSLNMSSFLKEQQKLLAEYQAKSAALNYDNIINNIQYIDRQVSECFNAFTTLDSASQVIAARAAVYLKAVKQIMNFPLKTGYSAIEFGKLAEAIQIDTKNNEAIINSDYTPYFERQYYKCCYGKFTINNGDPGRGLANDIFVGSVYASLLSDVDGGVKLHKYKNSKYVVTYEQTHGSGKCKKVVVPYTTTEPRIYENYGQFLTEVVAILNSLLNKPLMVKLKDVKAAVSDVATSCSKIGERRKPYMEKLIQYREYQEQAFMIRHVIELIQKDFRYEDKLIMPKDCVTKTLSLDSGSSDNPNEEEISSNKKIIRDYYSAHNEVISYTNSIMRGFTINDIKADIDNSLVDQFNDRLKTIRLKHTEIASLCAKLAAKEKEQEENEEKEKEKSGRGTVSKGSTTSDVTINVSSVILKLGILTDPELANDNFTTIYELKNNTDRQRIVRVLSEDKDKVEALDAECVELYSEALAIAVTFRKKIRSSIKQRSYKHNDKKLLIQSFEDFDTEMREKIELTIEAFKSLPDIKEFIDNHNDYSQDLISINNEVVVWSIFGEGPGETDRTFDYLVVPVHHKLNHLIGTDDTIQIGKLTYSLPTLLKHEHIFSFMPFSDMLMRKIKYKLFTNTEVSDGEVYSKLQEKYGDSIASYFSEYISKEASNRNLIALLAYGCVASPKRCLASLLAFQGDQLGVFLKKIGMETYNVSCVENQILKLLK